MPVQGNLVESFSRVADYGQALPQGSAGSRTLEPLKKPEVLAPAGGWPQLRAAVENGADAVYFGLSSFNARARAANFTLDELEEVMVYLHQRGVKGFVTVNVLIFDEELAAVEEHIRHIAACGVDAVIVQDVGVVRLIRRVAPALPIHGSTQMSITSAEGAEFARALGVERVVVGRELSVADIARVGAESHAEVEAFVHGALCVSYSGQCFSSEAWGGRSANRGQCAQACRMPYGLVVNGELRDLGDLKYLLSPQDLMALDCIPGLIKAGVSCLKIEGRLKGPEYVAVTTQAYRQAVDAAWDQVMQQASGPHASSEGPSQLVTEQQRKALHQVFARGQDEEHRGLTPGFLEGTQHQTLVRGRAPRHRGVLVGRIAAVDAKTSTVTLEVLEGDLKRGDGVVFDSGSPEDDEEGGTVYDIKSSRKKDKSKAALAVLMFGPGQVDFKRVKVGDLVWRNKDAAVEAQARASYDSLSSTRMRKVTVDVVASGSLGQVLELQLFMGGRRVGHATSRVPLQPAAKRPLDEPLLRVALGQLGENTLCLGSLDTSALDLAAGLFMPLSELKAVRRAAAEQCVKALSLHNKADGLATALKLPELLPAVIQNATGEMVQRRQDPQLRVLCRSMAQVEAACAVPWLKEVILDFLEVHGLRQAVALVRDAHKRCIVATPRVLKPGEERLARFYLKLQPDALLLRSTGLLHQLTELGEAGDMLESLDVRMPKLEGDFSLNAANVLSADLLLGQGLARLTPTHDLNAAQLSALASSLGPERAAQLEAIIHQHLPIFHTEHCVFCRFLSSGNSHLDCGHPCESNALHLRDGSGHDHLVLADEGCRNTVFNAQPQSGVWHARDLVAAGIGCFRVELVDEPAEQVEPILEAYRDVLSGERPPGSAWKWLGTLPARFGAVEGLTTGSLEVKGERTAASLKPVAWRT
ncbi:g3901 [Coccomyxa elongata]